jgi:hypothetical protein
MNEYFSPTVVNSKPYRLNVLSNLSDQHWSQLKAAYADGRSGVVKNTTSKLWSHIKINSDNAGTNNDSSMYRGRDNGTLVAPPESQRLFMESWVFA